jgi:hypothetical protein
MFILDGNVLDQRLQLFKVLQKIIESIFAGYQSTDKSTHLLVVE